MKNNSINELLKSLEAPYLKGEYDKVIGALLENKSRINKGLFYYNLGTLHIKKNDYAIARYHLEKALKHGMVNSKLLHNIDFVKKQLNVRELGNSPVFLDRAMGNALDLPSSLYVTASLLLGILTLILIKTGIFKKTKVMVISFLIALAPFLLSRYYLEKVDFAITLKEAVLREGPSDIYPELAKISAGTKFIVGEFTNGRFYIKYPDFLAGWIDKNDLAIY